MPESTLAALRIGTERERTALESSAVCAMVRTTRPCRCCGLDFAGGPDRIAHHVEGTRGGGIQACMLENGDPAIVAELAEIQELLIARRAKAKVARDLAEQSRAGSPCR